MNRAQTNPHREIKKTIPRLVYACVVLRRENGNERKKLVQCIPLGTAELRNDFTQQETSQTNGFHFCDRPYPAMAVLFRQDTCFLFHPFFSLVNV